MALYLFYWRKKKDKEFTLFIAGDAWESSVHCKVKGDIFNVGRAILLSEVHRKFVIVWPEGNRQVRRGRVAFARASCAFRHRHEEYLRLKFEK